MFGLRRILFPVDFSDRSIAIARRVKALAERFHSEVILLHVLAPLQPHVAAFDLTSMIPEALATLKERFRQELDSFLENELAQSAVRRVLAEGDPAETIAQYAQALDADLILMPTRGMGVFRRYVIGSVTAKVLHDADIPVWTGIHREAAPPFSALIEHIVCAVDPGPQSVKPLTWASGLAGELKARLTLLHVAPDLEPVPGHYFDPDWRLSVLSWTREELEKIQRAADTHRDVHIETGSRGCRCR